MTQITTETLAATAPAGTTVTEYRGYQIVDKGDCYQVIRGADYIGGANLIDEAKALADADIEKRAAKETTGTLITAYRSYAIREAARVNGISVGVDVYFYGAFIFNAPNVAQAKSRIDYAIATDSETLVDFPPAPVTTPSTLSAAERKAANAKKMGRHEPKETDLI